MYNGTESFEHAAAYRQELDRRIDLAARERDVQKLLAPTNPDRGADLGKLRRSGILAALTAGFRLGRRLEQLPGS
jgi:hypothetical protein